MKAAIYNPYLDTLGGGERYALSFAKVLEENGCDVDIEWSDPEILKSLEKKFGLGLTNIKVVPSVKRGEGYDYLFWVSDGSIPLLHSRHNLLHFQIPFKNVNGKSLINKMKFFRIEKIICNSEFTKKIIDREYGVYSLVLYPPVDTKSFKPKKKENIILSVSRFSQLTQSKRQDVLIDAYGNLPDAVKKEWKLILAGGTEVGSDEFLKEIKEKSTGLNIEIVENPDFNYLKALYGRSRVFWTASGYNIDEEKEPQKVEHFGMAVVEAMSSGCIPLAFDRGGHRESIKNGENGYLWNTTEELSNLTKVLLENKDLQKSLIASATQASQKFSYENFRKNIESYL